MKPRILLVEDDAAGRFGFVRYFSQEGYSVTEAADLAAASEAVALQRFDAIILDINLPDGSGIDFIEAVRAADTSTPIVVTTGAGDIPLAVDAMRRGADNFLTKPIDNAGLAVFLRKTLEVGALKRQQVARQRLEPRNDETIFGNDPAMATILDHARIAASNDCPVLIVGETGTGKGKLATWIHRNSGRSKYEFVEVNCSGLRGELLAREIFGNVRGAFTSADQDRKGLLDIADRGTLFLDEIGDMDLGVQAQFLKVLEDKSYRRLGDVKLLRSDFRLICATNRDIDELVAKGLFRQDLLYRINLMALHLPPLRERLDDLPMLAANMLRSAGAADSTLPADVAGLLRAYAWPGNIRELKNILERAVLLAHGSRLRPEHFSALARGSSGPSAQVPAGTSIHAAQEAHIQAVLDQTAGNIDKAAKLLGISRATLYRKVKRSRSA
jgi:DNA-binding NtrC family response regulator